MRYIGRYEVRGLLGRGGMGAVYKGFDPDTGHIVAIKLLDPNEFLVSLAGAAEIERRFEAEAETMAELDHPHIARVLDRGRDQQGRPYFTLEYCCDNVGAAIGETYVVEDASRVLPVDTAVDYARQTLLGLATLHSAGIVHRDIKPFNLLLTREGTLKIIDFGLSKLRGERIRLHRAEKVGSPYYAAPEQEENPEGVDRTADIYAVGVMLHRMLTGALPEIACTLASGCNPDLDADWDDLLATATALIPAERYPDAPAMLKALDACYQSWMDRLEHSCTLPEAAPQVEYLQEVWPVPLRSAPVHTGPGAGPETFGADALWRPQVYMANDLRPEGETVIDAATGLTWQQAGSPDPLTWEAAHEYVSRLNKTRFAGYGDWRLPTAMELLSIIRPPRQGRDFCIPSSFEATRTRLWSADRRTFMQAWHANTELGHLAPHDFTCHDFVRAVR